MSDRPDIDLTDGRFYADGGAREARLGRRVELVDIHPRADAERGHRRDYRRVAGGRRIFDHRAGDRLPFAERIGLGIDRLPDDGALGLRWIGAAPLRQRRDLVAGQRRHAPPARIAAIEGGTALLTIVQLAVQDPVAAVLHRVRSIILEREKGSDWAARLPEVLE